MKPLRRFGVAFLLFTLALLFGFLLFGQIDTGYGYWGTEESQTPLQRLFFGSIPGTENLPLWLISPNLLIQFSIVSLFLAAIYVGLTWSIKRLIHIRSEAVVRIIQLLLLLFLLTCSILAGSCVNWSAGYSLPRKTVLARDIVACPNWHHKLKDVPVDYSWWEGRTSEVVCSTCQFTLDAHGSWHGSSTNAATFRHPLTPFLLNLPSAIALETRSPSRWSQTIESGLVQRELADLDVSLPIEEVRNRITGWFTTRGITAAFLPPKRNPWMSDSPLDYYYLGVACVTVELKHYLTETNVHITVTHDLWSHNYSTNRACATAATK